MRRTLSLVVAVSAAAITTLLVVAYLSKPVTVPPDPPVANGEATERPEELPLDVLESLVARAHVAIAQLENLQLEEADEALLDISDKLPAEVLGPRNLTVCRLLAFEAGNRTRAEVDEALEMLRKVDPDSAVTHWLLARAAMSAMEKAPEAASKAQELAAALTALEAAAVRDPENALYPFAIFEATRTSSAEQLQQRGLEALRTAHQKSPDNLYVLSEWLLTQSQQEDVGIVETMETFRTTLAPLMDQLQRMTGRQAPTQFIDQAISAAREGDWRLVGRSTRIVAVNALRPLDVAKSDMRQLQPHDLEFIVSRFSDEVERRLAAAAVVEPNSVRLTVKNRRPVPSSEFIALRLVDFDLDGDLDLLALADHRLDVYQDADLSSREPLLSTPLPSGSRGLLVADLDHDRDQAVSSTGCFDADVDIVVYGMTGYTVLRNVFDAASQTRSLVAVDQPGDGTPSDVRRAVLIDLDHDSDLDLVASTSSGIRIASADGNLVFADVTRFSELPPGGDIAGSLLAVDWDRDVDTDVIVTFPATGTIGWLENLRHGNFRWIPFGESFAALGDATDLALIDFDGNASWDLAGVGAAGVHTVWTHTSPRGVVQASHLVQNGQAPQRRVLGWDFDNNGFQDLVSWGNGTLEVRRGDSEQSLAVPVELFETAPANVITSEVGDIDLDGDQDLLVLTANEFVLYENEGGNQNHWLDVRALGQVDNKGKVNHNGIGSLLEVTTSRRYQAQVVNRPVSHFGLGRNEQADSLRFLWTNGVPQAVVEPQADQAICELMTLKGSCPYLYAWNGDRFEFVTDLLWAAPLGLQVAAGRLAPARAWEYLLIEGDQLKRNGNRYDLRITEELWEAAYFDEVALIAVDHPADVQIFSNEKVGPAEIARHQIHTVSVPRHPVAARDSRGRDVLDSIAARDGNYFQGFETRYLPGSVEPHYLELDLGRLTEPQQITLFLTGWIYPTDTSLNIAISQNPTSSPPRPPAVEVLDSEGQWREVISYMGFPGGKTKTIAVDLSSAFLTDDYRLRIVTSNEIYWDHLFFTVDEPTVDLEVTPLSLASAELRFRGFSAARPQPERSPEIYDYAKIQVADKWPPMRGRFTRYGDVTELLGETDDRLAVLSAGDEIALSFEVPQRDPPPGWERDFLIYNVGWDKDADLNTVFGQSVEPLPFVGMTSYPYFDAEYPTTPRQREYLEKYQTREIDRTRFWRQLRHLQGEQAE